METKKNPKRPIAPTHRPKPVFTEGMCTYAGQDYSPGSVIHMGPDQVRTCSVNGSNQGIWTR